MRDFFKKMVAKIGTAVIIAIILGIPTLLGLACVGGFAMEFVQIVGNGSMWLGIAVIPFFVFGIIQMLRGFLAIVDRDIKKLDSMGESIWHSIGMLLCFPATIAGYIAVLWAFYSFLAANS